jgi:sec-independent protein translocase protein TatB
MPGFWEWLTLAVLALLIFGPERLPKVARTAGQMVAKFRAEARATLDELKVAADLHDVTSVRDELRETARDLRASTDLRSDFNVLGPTSGSAAAVAAGTTPSAGPAPFDPDTP